MTALHKYAAPIGLLCGALFALAVFGGAEVVHHAELNPFEEGE